MLCLVLGPGPFLALCCCVRRRAATILAGGIVIRRSPLWGLLLKDFICVQIFHKFLSLWRTVPQSMNGHTRGKKQISARSHLVHQPKTLGAFCGVELRWVELFACFPCRHWCCLTLKLRVSRTRAKNHWYSPRSKFHFFDTHFFCSKRRVYRCRLGDRNTVVPSCLSSRS